MQTEEKYQNIANILKKVSKLLLKFIPKNIIFIANILKKYIYQHYRA